MDEDIIDTTTPEFAQTFKGFTNTATQLQSRNTLRQDMSDSSKVRFWQHDNLYRIQDCRQITDRHGTTHDAWESRRDENGVLFFVSEEQAKAYLQESKVESEETNHD